MTRLEAKVLLIEYRAQLNSINEELGLVPYMDLYTEELQFQAQRLSYQIECILKQYPTLK